MSVVKTIGNICLVILCIVSLIVTGLFVYYRYIDPSQTIGVNNIDDQVALDYEEYTGDLTESEIQELEDRKLFEVNVYTNENMNGVTLVEFQMNYFTTWRLELTDYRSTGYQLVANFDPATNFTDNLIFNSLYGFEYHYNENFDSIYSSNLYEKTTSVDWSANGPTNTGFARDKEYIVKIKDEAYSINLNKTYTKSEPLWGFLWNVENTYNRTVSPHTG